MKFRTCTRATGFARELNLVQAIDLAISCETNEYRLASLLARLPESTADNPEFLRESVAGKPGCEIDTRIWGGARTHLCTPAPTCAHGARMRTRAQSTLREAFQNSG